MRVEGNQSACPTTCPAAKHMSQTPLLSLQVLREQYSIFKLCFFNYKFEQDGVVYLPTFLGQRLTKTHFTQLGR